MNNPSIDRPHATANKPFPKPKSGHVLVADYSCRIRKGFSIVLNTPIPKMENHYVYGDRVERVLNEMHGFYEEGRLVREIRLALGDEEMLMNQKVLVNEMFPKMNQLKKMQRHPNHNKYTPKIALQVTWQGSPQIATVKCSYMRQYEPQLFAQYNQVRRKIQDKWKAYVKNSGKMIKGRLRKRMGDDLMQQSSANGRKMLKVQQETEQQQLEQQELGQQGLVKQRLEKQGLQQLILEQQRLEREVIWLSECESIGKEQDSTDDNRRQDQKNDQTQDNHKQHQKYYQKPVSKSFLSNKEGYLSNNQGYEKNEQIIQPINYSHSNPSITSLQQKPLRIIQKPPANQLHKKPLPIIPKPTTISDCQPKPPLISQIQTKSKIEPFFTNKKFTNISIGQVIHSGISPVVIEIKDD